MLKLFEELGALVTRKWARKNFDESSFPDVAVDSLIESDVLNRVELEDIIDWFVTSPTVPEQQYRDFGQPPINVFLSERFFIEVLFWYDSTTTIHQHAFSGAFGVLAGSSLHTSYHFELGEEISSHLKFGKVQFISSELLQRGDVRPIHIGNQLIHSLFHLERPSLSLVIRVKTKNEYKPQFNYLRPSLAINPECKEEPFYTQLRLLAGLGRTDPNAFWRTAKSIIQSGNIWPLYPTLSLSYKLFHEAEEWADLVSVARRYHARYLNYLLPCVIEQSREAKIIEKRKSTYDPESRFFLALLLNIPTRQAFFDMVSRRYPSGRQAAIILRWITRLSDTKLIGFKFEGVELKLLEAALSGASFEDVKTQMVNSPSTSALSALSMNESELEKLWIDIKNNQILRPLF
jgi:hypothetical protein